MMRSMLHPLVEAMSQDVTVQEGRLALNEVRLVAHREAALALDAMQKKAVVVSLVAYASRLLREARSGSEATVERLMTLAGEVSRTQT